MIEPMLTCSMVEFSYGRACACKGQLHITVKIMLMAYVVEVCRARSCHLTQ